MLLRTENIAEDERFYKAISGLDDKTGQETIEHGNASPRKCEFKPLLGSLLRFDISVTSKQFWDQVEVENIVMMEAAFAYKHDFQLFGYSAKDYLSNIGKHIGS